MSVDAEHVRVRPRETTDLTACAQVLARVYETDGYPVEGVSEPRAWLLPTALRCAWVGTLDDHVVGHVCLTAPQPGDEAAQMWAGHFGEPPERIAVLGRLFVLSEARGHSLGERLIAAATDYAAAAGLRLVLDVMDKDQAAIRLYERLGWLRIGTAVHDSGHDNVPAVCFVSPPGNA